MRYTMLHSFWFQLVVLLALLSFAGTARAGPPLLCHPFDIGNNKSLPWGDSRDWKSPRADYDITGLVQDTLQLLSPETPVIVRMETLRRATIYGEKNQQIAVELLSSLMARALDRAASDRFDTLAWFDAGYLVETYKQAKWMYEKQGSWISKKNWIQELNGYGWVTNSLRLGGDTASIEFAACLMKEGTGFNEHFQRAVAGAADGSLLARNLVLQFGDQGKSIAELRAKYTKPKN